MQLALMISGWVAAALALGLWLGERGRRMDAQRREGKVPVGRVKRAKVTEPKPSEQVAALVGPTVTVEERKEQRDRYVEAGMHEGFSRKELEADFDDMMLRAGAGNIE